MPKLHILSPSSLTATIELTESLITIGRTPENSICIQDTNVSRRHGILVRDGDNYQLHDFKSSNGTFVNGEQIMAAKLKDHYVHELPDLGPVQFHRMKNAATSGGESAKSRSLPFISKSKFLWGLQCHKLLWFAYNQKDAIPKPDAATQAR